MDVQDKSRSIGSSLIMLHPLLQGLRQAEHSDEEEVRINQWQCKAGDTVPGSMSELRGNPTINIKIDLINKRPVDQFQRLN